MNGFYLKEGVYVGLDMVISLWQILPKGNTRGLILIGRAEVVIPIFADHPSTDLELL